MARRRYYRSRRVYPRQKWLPVNNEVSMTTNSVGSGCYTISYSVITQNSSRTSADGSGNISSASILKCGRFKFRGTITSSDSGISYIFGIAYIPEGYSINSSTSISTNEIGGTFFYRHPEWVLAWTRLDFLTGTENEIRLSSILKRNLNTGDGIVFFRIAINRTSTERTVSSTQGTISYVCRTN